MANIPGFICDLCGKEVRSKDITDRSTRVLFYALGAVNDYYFPELIQYANNTAVKREAECCFECSAALISAIQQVVERKQKQ